MCRSILLLGIAAIFGQAGQDAPAKPPAEEYKDRVARVRESLAEEHYKVGEYLAGVSMHRWAREEYRKSVGFSADHAEARKRLGYVQKDGEWEPDPNAPLETENKKKGTEEEKLKQEYDKRVEKLGKNIGRLWAELGNWCEKNKLKPEAEAAWKLAIEYDPLNTDSRKKLGYVRQKDGPWLSKFETSLRKEMKEGMAKSPSGSPHKEETEVEADLGWKHEKRKSVHFLVQAAGQNQEWLSKEVKHGEHAYAIFHKMFNQKEELFSQEYNLIVVKDKSAHEAYVDKYVQSGDQTRKDFLKKMNGIGGFPRSLWIKGEREDVHDWVIHVTTESLFEHLVGGSRPWMKEGLAYHFTKTMLGTAGVMCVNLAGTGSGGEKNLQNPEDWPLVIRTWIKESKDPAMAEVFKCKEIAELSGSETVKGWSMIDFLITEHRERFIEFLSKLRGQREEDDEKTLKEVFGWTLEDFDLRWRTYARASY
jgi:hypothetical protein